MARLFDPDAGPWPSRAERTFEAVVLAVYLAVVVIAAFHHELWRDEVRALSIARDGTIADMFRALRHEGHPAVWYLLLRAAYAAWANPVVLPVLSGLIGASSVAVMLRAAPMAPGHKALLACGGLLAYQYSVMCRNYGLAVLMLFVLAATYASRHTRPFRWGLLLAVLANTSAHGAVIAAGIALGWAVECAFSPPAELRPQGWNQMRKRTVAGILIAGAGIAACAWTIWPGAAPAVFDSSAPGGGMAASTIHAYARDPGAPFVSLLPLGALQRFVSVPEWAVSITVTVLLGLFAYALWQRRLLFVAFVSGIAGLEVLFRTVNPASPQQAGLLFIMMIALYWCALGDRALADVRATRVRRRLAVAFAVVLMLHTVDGVRMLRLDLQHEMSASKAFGALLRTLRFRNAIVIAEPEFAVEAVPAYAPNRLYAPRAQSEFTYSRFYGGPLSLGELLRAAEQQARQGQPVLIALGVDVTLTDSGDVQFDRRSDTRLTWTADERAAFLRRADRLVAYTPTLQHEEFTVYVLRTPDATPAAGRSVNRVDAQRGYTRDQ